MAGLFDSLKVSVQLETQLSPTLSFDVAGGAEQGPLARAFMQLLRPKVTVSINGSPLPPIQPAGEPAPGAAVPLVGVAVLAGAASLIGIGWILRGAK